MSTTLDKKLAFIRIAAGNPDAVRSFYETFFGIAFAANFTSEGSVSYQAPIDENNIDMMIGPQNDPKDSMIAYFAVDDINTAISDATAAGGAVLWGPMALPIAPAQQAAIQELVEQFYPADAASTTDWSTAGLGALIADPAGNPIGLVQLPPHAASHFNVGPNWRALNDTRVALHEASINP